MFIQKWYIGAPIASISFKNFVNVQNIGIKDNWLKLAEKLELEKSNQIKRGMDKKVVEEKEKMKKPAENK